MQIKAIIPPQKMKLIALRAVSMMQDNTDAGIDADGNAFAPYSTKPFARPSGGIPKKVQAMLKGAGKLKYFTTREGKLWAIIDGGYKALKEAIYPQDGGRVNISASGRTRKALMPIAFGENTATIGFSTEQAAEIMYYLSVAGAGKGKVIRKIMGLRPEQQEEIARLAGEMIVLNIK